MAKQLKELTGAFAESLLRNGTKIREDRGLALWNSAERVYRRKMEDLQSRIEDLESSRNALIDLSPNDVNSLTVPSDFNAEEFYDKDMKLTLDIRDTKIRFEEAKARYEALFSKKVEPMATV